jgi:hypothetical protein
MQWFAYDGLFMAEVSFSNSLDKFWQTLLGFAEFVR